MFDIKKELGLYSCDEHDRASAFIGSLDGDDRFIMSSERIPRPPRSGMNFEKRQQNKK